MARILRNHLLLLLLLIVAISAAAQPALSDLNTRQSTVLAKIKLSKNYTMADGLSNQSIQCIAQDEDGFMWFGTEEGLNRFDGERFKTFFHAKERTGLPSNIITQLLVLPGHRLLIATATGLCVLNTRSLVFTPVVLPLRKAYAEKDQLIFKLLLDRTGQIWAAATTGVYLLTDQGQVKAFYFFNQMDNPAAPKNALLEMIELPDGTVTLKLGLGIQSQPWQVLDFQQQKLTRLSLTHPSCAILDTVYMTASIRVQKNGSIWFSPMNNRSKVLLFCFDWATQSSRPILTNPFFAQEKYKLDVFDPLPLPDSLLLLQSYLGKMLLVDLRDNKPMELPWNTSIPDGSTARNFLDKDGNLWICPRFKGIFFVSLKKLPGKPFTAFNIEHQKSMASGGIANEWFGFTCSTVFGNYFLGSSNGGLYKYDNTTGSVSQPPLPYHIGASISYVSEFVPVAHDTIWANSLGGMYWINVKNFASGPLPRPQMGLDSFDNKFIFRDHYGLIWGRVRGNGVISYNPSNGKVQLYPSLGENAPFPLPSATAITEAPNGDLWFSFGAEPKYLVNWHRSTGKFEKIEISPKEGTVLEPAFILRADKWKNIWMQGRSKQIFMMDMQSHQVSQFGRMNGVVTDFIEGFTADTSGNIWFALPYGLTRYDPVKQQLRTFYTSDGLLSNSIFNVELLDTARNILLVSTGAGLCLFEPDKIETTVAAPPAFITGFYANDVETALPETGGLELDYRHNTIRIEFTGVNFINAHATRYQYRLDKADGNWREAGTDNFATYLNLPAGKYTFRVRAANSDGIWSDQEATLSITILPPFWGTWTFRISLLSAILFLAWWLYQRQIHLVQVREMEKNVVRQQMGDLEMKALRSQMNPHFVFNALNSVQNFVLKNDTREASRYLTKFARLMRLILENSESPVVPLAKEIELLRYYIELENLRFNNRFSFDIQIDSALNTELVSVPGMLIQPHIENAIWHGLMHKTAPGHLFVRFLKADEKTILCEIEDNGVGRVQAAELEKDRHRNHRSTGLANIRHRLELLNAQLAEDIRLDIEDLYDPAGKPCGTRVSVRMPVI